MADRTPADPGATPVTIFGRTYHLRGGGDPARLERLAEIVDAKMREIADATGTPDTLKVAILASLNIADESLDSRSGGDESDTSGIRRRVVRMVAELDEALVD